MYHFHPLEQWYHFALVLAFEMLSEQCMLILEFLLRSLQHREQRGPITHHLLLVLAQSQVVVQCVREDFRNVPVRFIQSICELNMVNQLVKRVLPVLFLQLPHFVWHFHIGHVDRVVFFICFLLLKYGHDDILI
jgi:hypothetical protein